MIFESQLETWSHQGATTNSAATYASIKAALEGYSGWPSGLTRSEFLQGSYPNYTNIFGDSDVDIVCLNPDSFMSDIRSLDKSALDLYNRKYPDTNYTYRQYKADVVQALSDWYGSGNVDVANKAIKVTTSHLKADVIAALEYREFRSEENLENGKYYSGVAFRTTSNNELIGNFPKQHISNGSAKNASSSNMFKPTVRIFKHARNRAMLRGWLGNGIAPSYFVECLISNAPNSNFSGSLRDIFESVISWAESTDLTKLNQLNDLYYLCRNAQGCWNSRDAKLTIDAWRTVLEQE